MSGMRPELEYALSPGSVLVTLGGPVADLDRIDPASFTITIDVAALEPGSHQVQPSPVVQAGLSIIKVDPDTVTVTVSQPSSAAPSGGTP
jgi:YbbR domain-containing protein